MIDVPIYFKLSVCIRLVDRVDRQQGMVNRAAQIYSVSQRAKAILVLACFVLHHGVMIERGCLR